jgi:hypothetical protein
MVDLEILKVFSMTEKTVEDIETIMSMTQGLKFVISYNDPDVHRLICQNMHMKSYIKNECVFDSSKMEDINFLIYSGKINIYILEKPGPLIVIHDNDSSLSSDESASNDKNKKSDDKKKKKLKDNKENDNEEQNSYYPKNMILIRELKTEDCFGSFEVDIMKQNNTRFEKLLAYASEPSKLIIFEKKSNLPQGENKILSRRDMYQTQREINNKDKNNPKYYDPEIFLFDDPQKFISVIDKVKEQVNEGFNNDQDFFDSKNIMSELKKEKEFLDVCDHLNTSDLKDTLNYIESKYSDYYNDQSILELKLGIVVQKSLNNMEKGQNDLLKDMDSISHKYYDKKNNKNKNLVQLNIDNELKDNKFEDYVYEKLNTEKKLDELLKQKKLNDKHIEANKKKIKKEENELLNTYYCIYCHVKPRNAMSNNCHHLVICEECIKKTKVCPRCGKNIDSYHKIYRS